MHHSPYIYSDGLVVRDKQWGKHWEGHIYTTIPNTSSCAKRRIPYTPEKANVYHLMKCVFILF